MGILFHLSPEAELDVFEIHAFYELRDVELGQRFLREYKSALLSIAQQPLLWREREGGYRRMNLATFPYYLIYIVEGESASLVAVAHSSRHPDFWKNRIP